MGDCKDGSSVWYFAFGSMCNPVSLRRRGVIPYESKPAVIHGYRLAFQLDMFKVLCKIEATYDIIRILATPYQPYHPTASSTSSIKLADDSNGTAAHIVADSTSTGSIQHSNVTRSHADAPATVPGSLGIPVTAVAFIVQPEHLARMKEEHPEWPAALPSQRYINIITAGLKYHGADPAWIQAVAAEPHTPAVSPEQYLKFPAPPTISDGKALVKFTVQQLAEYQGKVLNNKVVMACGDKVLEVDISAKPNAPYVVYLKDHMSGRCNVYGTCMNLYDPTLPSLETPADLRKEHVEWCEHFTMEWMTQHKFAVQQIGWLDAPLGAASGTVVGS